MNEKQETRKRRCDMNVDYICHELGATADEMQLSRKNEQHHLREAIEILRHLQETNAALKSRLAEMTRPSIMLRPKIYVDGDMWCALYGDNIQDGVAGFGKSPGLAMRNFDVEFDAKLKDKP